MKTKQRKFKPWLIAHPPDTGIWLQRKLYLARLVEKMINATDLPGRRRYLANEVERGDPRTLKQLRQLQHHIKESRLDSKLYCRIALDIMLEVKGPISLARISCPKTFKRVRARLASPNGRNTKSNISQVVPIRNSIRTAFSKSIKYLRALPKAALEPNQFLATVIMARNSLDESLLYSVKEIRGCLATGVLSLNGTSLQKAKRRWTFLTKDSSITSHADWKWWMDRIKDVEQNAPRAPHKVPRQKDKACTLD